LGTIRFTLSAFAQENVPEIENGLRIPRSQSKCAHPREGVFEKIAVLSECGPGFGLRWEAGFVPRTASASEPVEA